MLELKTNKLYKEASKKFDIYHISVEDDRTNYNSDRGSYEEQVDKSFKDVIGESAVDRDKKNLEKYDLRISAFLKAFAEGVDTHNLYAKLCFPEELIDVDVGDVKLRQGTAV